MVQDKLKRAFEDWKLLLETFNLGLYKFAIIPSASTLNSLIWPVLKPRKSYRHLTVGCHGLEAVVQPSKPLIPSLQRVEMTDSIHSAAAEHSAFTDLAKSVLFCVYFSSPSSVFGLLLWRDTDSFTWLPWGNLSTIATAQPQRAGSVLYPLCAMSIMSWALMTSLLRTSEHKKCWNIVQLI